MKPRNNETNIEPIGYCALLQMYKFKLLPYYRASFICKHGAGYEKQVKSQKHIVYPKSYALKNPSNPLAQLEFALKYDGLHLSLLNVLFPCLSEESVTGYIQEKPTSKYRRKIWFLYETLLNTQLSLPNLKSTPYVDLLESDQYYTGYARKSTRHAINNNLLGTTHYSPMVRRTSQLIEFEKMWLSNETQKLIQSVPKNILSRATNYLYTKETMSSFGIENIKPDKKRADAFIDLLHEVNEIKQLDKTTLITLQNAIVDENYKDVDYRSNQNYVGELTRSYRQKIHYISPKPSDLKWLMEHFIDSANALIAEKIDPVIVATVISFMFVFLHPFEDGNGRLHRFLIHYVLVNKQFAKENIIFPVSAVMLKDRKAYYDTLETFSVPLLRAINNYTLNDEGELSVHEDTLNFYQYVDLTVCAEYLYSCIKQTINIDFKEELAFLQTYDKVKLAIQSIVDMPDLKIDRAIKCISQNNGRLGVKMRQSYFSSLSDEQVSEIEVLIQKSGLIQ